jgi:cell division protein ZapB
MQKTARMGYSFCMDKELASLAQKIQLAAELCQRLRKENQNLRQELAAAQQRAKLLSAKLDTAKARVETIIDNLPAS